MQFTGIFILLILLGGMMFMSSRTQKKQKQARDEMQTKLVRGAEVETISGLIATVDEVDQANNRIVLDVEGVYLTFDLQRSIMRVISSPASASNEAATSSDSADKEEGNSQEDQSAIEE
ncbi:preprotein translocase subunit YajC [Streptococcus downei]|uniref:Putative preprotein translocase, YajC subunit n=1 Tax=Streptococcus downei MFe28 TaxID=764290 RepID=A0A380JAX9_STRDO|nr:preprotein translocase subunit YajC [Streptococcus downei]EFQ58355.1 preprotein translocase, YajC subunit [Streptococcus downei F0415]SUN35228.1 putative preprotein translocase, YajC subunit [Streptococcus downei MFe28]